MLALRQLTDARIAAAIALFISLSAGCDGCSTPVRVDAGPDAGLVGGDGDGDVVCTTDNQCDDGLLCIMGTCQPPSVPDGGTGGEDAGTPGEDAGLPIGVLTVSPDTDLEFGAQLVGVPVTRDVQLSNTGNAPLTVVAIVLDDGSGEFSSNPAGTINEVLDVGDVLPLEVSHTPTDGSPDEAEITILHDGQGNLTTLNLFAEFKGAAALSVTDEVGTFEPTLEEYDFGAIVPDVPVTSTLYVRNTGALDSVLEVTDITLTPATVGFTAVGLDDLELPIVLGSNAHHLCPDGDVGSCPADADACTDMVCTAAGVPTAALPLDIEFVTSGLPAQAVLSIEYLDAGEEKQADITLLGRATEPEMVISPSAVNFGASLVNAASPVTTVTIENVGAGPLLITLFELPTNAAFEATPEAPVPTQMGQLPVVIDPAGTFTIDVTFTPTATEAYTDVLTLHTNDPSATTAPITIAGTGVECQENAEVNAMGECVCSPGFNTCGDECLPDAPNSCGPTCIDCTGFVGTGTDADCVSGSCSYSCQEAWYDLDDDVADDYTQPGWTACEYLCPQNPPLGFELCNTIDDDCDGERDEGLPPDSDDLSGMGASCTNAATPFSSPLDATENGATSQFTRTIYPTGDDDWFRIDVVEGENSPACIESIPCIEGGFENYQTDFSVTSPTGASYEMEVFVPAYFDECTAGNTYTGANISHAWQRSSDLFDCVFCVLFDACYPGGYGCAFDDHQVYYVRVLADDADPDNFSCEPYTLSITTTATDSF